MAPISHEFADFNSFRVELGNGNSEWDFPIVNINIRSLRKYWDTLKIIAESATECVDVFVITEINIPDSYGDLFALPNYKTHVVTRPYRRGGGIAIFL